MEVRERMTARTATILATLATLDKLDCCNAHFE
jgi:hypothetical protein